MESSEARMKKRLAISLNIYVVFKLEEPETEILLRSPRLLDLIKANKFSHLKNRRTIFESFFFFSFPLFIFFFPYQSFIGTIGLLGLFVVLFGLPVISAECFISGVYYVTLPLPWPLSYIISCITGIEKQNIPKQISSTA